MELLIADGEKGLDSEQVRQFLDRYCVQFKAKAPGEHARWWSGTTKYLGRRCIDSKSS